MILASKRLARRGVVIANPGGVSWMIRSAKTFAEHGELAAYCSPAVFSERELAKLARRLPAALTPRIINQLRLRAAPPSVPPDLLARAATPSEVIYVLGIRMDLPHRIISALDHRQALAFDRGVSRLLNASLDAVIGYQGTAARTFHIARKLGVPCVLDFPIAHYAEVERVLGEEVRRVPAYAGTMQGPHYERWRKRRYAAEIDIADRIIIVSSYHRRTFELAGVDPERLFMAPFGVDLDLFSPRADVHEGPFRVLFCGQITQRKGISYLVDGFKRAALGNAELVLAGRPFGTRHPWIDEPRVRHINAVPRPQLVEVYRSADVIVLPSLIEGFPSTPLEGMACGLPAIVSEHTFGHDVIEEGVDGWVVPIRDSDSIAEKLRLLYEDPDRRRRMGMAARRKAEQFTWTRYGESLRSGIAPLVLARAVA
jgi:glycosyltransferase involved in cell wall biosynthesis